MLRFRDGERAGVSMMTYRIISSEDQVGRVRNEEYRGDGDLQEFD